MAEVRSLMEYYHLKDEDCNHKISDRDIDEISRYYCSKWRSLPSHLEMKSIDASDVAHGPGDEQEKRRTFLLKWKDMKGSAATYKQLISALLEIHCRDEAEGVCKLIQQTASSHTASIYTGHKHTVPESGRVSHDGAGTAAQGITFEDLPIPSTSPSLPPKGSHHGAGSAAQVTTFEDLPIISLDENDLPKVLRSVLDILAKWNDLGMALDIKVCELNVIEAEKATLRKRMETMLLAWLRGRGKDPTWQTLCEALRDPLVECDYITKKVEKTVLENYNKS